MTVGALMLVLALASLDQMIVATALPTIVGELGDDGNLSWAVTAYLLTATIAGPLYGKLGDLYGRRSVLRVAIAIFLLGSALCGLSQSMTELIAFRALQGIGGGGLMVVTRAAIGDVVAARERGRYQGLLDAVFGASTVIGPLLGGFLVEHASWRWIFYVNIPAGLVSMIVIGATFAPPRERSAHRVDFLGAAVLSVALAAIVVSASLAGTVAEWNSALIIGLLATGSLLLIVFGFVERRAAEPILPPALFRDRNFFVPCAIGFGVGLALFGAMTYFPLYLQLVQGQSPTTSGLMLIPMEAGFLIASIGTGLLISRSGRYRLWPIAGTLVLTFALCLLARLEAESPTWHALGGMIVFGLGLGMVIPVLLLVAQNAVDRRLLGVATSASLLLRQLGASLGVAALGAILVNTLSSELAALRADGRGALTSTTDPVAVAELRPTLRSAYVEALANSLTAVFLAATGVAFVAFLLSWLLREDPLRETT